MHRSPIPSSFNHRLSNPFHPGSYHFQNLSQYNQYKNCNLTVRQITQLSQPTILMYSLITEISE